MDHTSQLVDPRWVLTDLRGDIVDVSADGASLFHRTRSGLIGRNLYDFFDRERASVIHCAGVAARGGPISFEGLIRPRDRKPFPMRVTIQATSVASVPVQAPAGAMPD